MIYDSIQVAEGSKLLNLVIDSGTSFPQNPDTGELFFRTDSTSVFVYTGQTWVDVSGSAGSSSLPTQTGNSGKYLTTDGSTASWAIVDSFPSQTGNSGKYLTTDGASTSWQSLEAVLPSQTGNSGKILTTDGTSASWAALTAGSGISISSNTISNTGILSIVAGTNVAVSTTSGNATVSFAGTLPISSGGTGQTTAATALTALLPSQSGNSGKSLVSNGTSASWVKVAPSYESAVATASQTVFNTTISLAANASSKSYVQVYVNGVLQMEGASKSFTVTSSNQITFTYALKSGDDVAIFSYA